MDQKQIEILKKEVKEDEATKAEKIRKLKKLLENHSFVIIPRIDDLFATSCLRGTKYDIEKSIKKCETFALFSKDFNEYVSWENELMDISYKMLAEGIVLPLESRDSLGRKIVLVDLGKRDVTIHSFADLIRTMMTVTSMMLQDDEITSLTGVVYIFDGSCLGLQHVPSVKDLQFLVKSAHVGIIRIKKIVMFKFPRFMTAPVKIMKSFQSKKMRERVELVDDVENVCSMIQPKSILPKHFGGDQDMESLIESAKETWNSEFCQERAKVFKNVHINWENVPKKGWLGF